MEKYIIVAIELKTRQEQDLEIEADEGETTENIILKTAVNGEHIATLNYVYFSAFQELRDCILELGYGLKCSGSRLNAVQSGMMCATDKIYLVELGKQAYNKDIVSIYDYCDIDSFHSTQEQNTFLEKWSNSL